MPRKELNPDREKPGWYCYTFTPEELESFYVRQDDQFVHELLNGKVLVEICPKGVIPLEARLEAANLPITGFPKGLIAPT